MYCLDYWVHLKVLEEHADEIMWKDHSLAADDRSNVSGRLAYLLTPNFFSPTSVTASAATAADERPDDRC